MDVDNPTFLEIFFIPTFICSLKLELQLMIRFLKPQTLNQVFEQTLLQEQSVIEISQSLYFTGNDAKFS